MSSSIIEYFYSLICAFLIIVCLFVFLADNPVHSVLFLILAFFNSSVLLFTLNIEFLGIILIIIYVGAIAVLFLFVVMMLNIKIVLLNFKLYYVLFFIISAILFQQISFILLNFFIQLKTPNLLFQIPYFLIDNFNIMIL